MFAIFISLMMQYFVAPHLEMSDTLEWMGVNLDFAWDCDEYTEEFQSECRGVSSVLRVSAATSFFFLISLVCSVASPSFNASFWGLKFTAFIVLVLFTMFMPVHTFDDHGYLQLARVGSTIFIVIQQIILIDLAYEWNDAWVKNSEDDEKAEPGSGDGWLKALLGISGIIFAAAFTALGMLFHYFGGCDSNNWFLSITLVFTLVATGLQLTGDEGSVLTSAIMAAYSVFLAYSAVSANPNATCNPQLGQDNVLAQGIGMTLIMASMAWTCFSYTKSSMLGGDSAVEMRKSGSQRLMDSADIERPAKGVVTGGGEAAEYGTASTIPTERDVQERRSEEEDHSSGSNYNDEEIGQPWKLNLVLILLSCWSAMVLTSWGTVQNEGSPANPSAGRVSMWMMMVAQWIALSLYSWSLVAPRLFPDRDFN
jgi:hypothetical protein